MTLTFDRDLPVLSPGTHMTFGDSSMRGAGSTIEDNVVEDIPFGRGIWIGGAAGITVRRNVVRTTSLSGIIVSQNVEPGAYPTPPARDIIIRSNAVEGALGPAAPGTGTQSEHGLDRRDYNRTTISLAPPDQHQHRDWRQLHRRLGPRRNLDGEAGGSSITNNFITRWHQRPHLPILGIHPDDWPLVYQDFRQPIAVRYSTGVAANGNDIRAQSSITAPVGFSTPLVVSRPHPAGAPLR